MSKKRSAVCQVLRDVKQRFAQPDYQQGVRQAFLETIYPTGTKHSQLRKLLEEAVQIAPSIAVVPDPAGRVASTVTPLHQVKVITP